MRSTTSSRLLAAPGEPQRRLCARRLGGELVALAALGVGSSARAAVAPAGTVTEFAAGVTPGSGPYGITTAPDGALWFVEFADNRIGRITPAGKITEFDVGGTAPDPDGITAGPDGNLWFSIRGQDSIGRITPAGAITRFKQGISPGAAPTGITAGPDGRSMAQAQDASPATVQRIWSVRGLKPHKVATFRLSTDPRFEEKLVDVVGLYLSPPEQAVVLCMDEKSQIQALHRTQAAREPPQSLKARTTEAIPANAARSPPPTPDATSPSPQDRSPTAPRSR